MKPDTPPFDARPDAKTRAGGASHLRLAYAAGGRAASQEQAAALRTGRVLVAVIPGSTDWRPSALHDLVRSLRDGDGALHITSQFGGQPSVRVEIHGPIDGEAPDDRLDWALRAAWPMLRFERPAAPAPAPASACPVQHVLQPQPLRLHGRSAGRRGAEVEIRQAWMPQPGRWPGAWIAAPFQSALHGAPWALEVAMRPWQPDDALRQHWWRLLQELKRGSLRAWHAAATEACQMPDTELDAAAQDLLRAWLRQREPGYSARVQVRADAPLDAWALRRIVADVFGLQRVDVLKPQAESACPPELRGVWLPEQGDGGWLPLPQGLLHAGVPAAAIEPGRLPEGPGAEIGRSASGRGVPVPDDVRAGHMLVVGASGSGKSTTLCRLLQQDMARGDGIVLIDPHGDLFERVLGLVPAARRDDVVVIDASDTTGSVAINPLEGTAADRSQRAFVAGSIVDLIGHLFENPESTGPVLRNHLRHTLLLAMCHPEGGTLADAPRIFQDRDFRQWLLSKADPGLNAYFSAFEQTSGEHGFTNWLPYIMARFEPFRSNRTLLATMSRPSTVNLASQLRSRAIMLVRIPRQVMTETECKVFGALMLQSCFRAAMGHGSQRLALPCRVVVDEFHLFATPAVPALFREARKFGLSMTVATQSFGSLRHPQAPNLVTDVLCNTAAKLLFRVSPSESSLLEEYTSPAFDARALTRIANRQAVLVLPSQGLEPVLLQMLPPSDAADVAGAEVVLTRSAARHAVPMAQAMDYLARRHGIDPDTLL